MKVQIKRDAAKGVSGRRGGGSRLLRSFGALLLAFSLLAAIPMGAIAADGADPAANEPAPAETSVPAETAAPTEVPAPEAETAAPATDTPVPAGEPDTTGDTTPEEDAGTTSDPAETAAPTEDPFSGPLSVIGNPDNDFVVTSNADESHPGELKQFRTGLTITDEDGKQVESGGIVYTGSKYTIHLEFKEKGIQSFQMALDGNGELHYQLPDIFETTPMTEPLTVTLTEDGVQKQVTIGTVSVDENGLVTVKIDEQYRTLFDDSSEIYDMSFSVDIEGTAGQLQKGEDYQHHFDDAGEEFWVELMDHPKVTTEKTGKFTEREDHSGGTLEYTVKTKVEHGELHDATIADVLTPPNNTDAFTLEMMKKEDEQPNVTVTLKKADGTTVELDPNDYDLVLAQENPDGTKKFTVKLKEGTNYNPLMEGDELDVTYQYNAALDLDSLNEFWGNVENDVTVTGHMPVDNPKNPEEQIDVEVEEHAGDNVEIRVNYGGNGVVWKTQEYSEATHTLHYTLYTVIPAGEWAPLSIYDDMYVQYDGKKWYLREFNDENGRVENLTVSAVDVLNWVQGWDSLTDEQKAEALEKFREDAEEVKVFPFDGWNVPEGYNPQGPGNIEQCARYFVEDGISMYVVFGLKNDDSWGNWGHWDYDKDRLIITEYDLDMSSAHGDTITLSERNGDGTLGESLTLTPKQVLQAGIRNNVNLRFGGYFPGYSVYFNNAETMNKAGAVNAKDNTIEYTVTMNTTDTTVNQYFQDVRDNWMAIADQKYHWNVAEAYKDEECMQAVFYDELPAGWEYVEGSLTATARNIWGIQSSYPYDENGQLEGSYDLVTSDGGKQAISAPLMFFYDDGNTFRNNLFNWFGSELASLTFTYKLKPTEEWLQDHQYELTGFEIDNHAWIKDKDSTHWDAESKVTYFTPQLTKEAKVIGKGMLKFTLEVNPYGLDFSKDDTLTVEDTSENLIIDPNTIEVKDAAGVAVEFTKTVTDGHFTLKVPDAKHLTITYLATIKGEGAAEKISNTALIEGIVGGESSYSDTFDVSKMIGIGTGTTNSMTVRKVDALNDSKLLADATFEYYLVRERDSRLDETGTITIGGKEYSYYHDDGMTVTTTTSGVKVEKNISPGNYYIFIEKKAPEGYLPDEMPQLVYFGETLPEDAPDGTKWVPLKGEYSWLTIDNTPIQSLRVVKVGGVSGEPKVPLAGAEFELVEATKAEGDGTYAETEDGKKYTGVSQSPDGVVTWNPELKLEQGKYYILRETKAPDGYNKLEQDIVFQVTDDGKLDLAGSYAGVARDDAASNDLVVQFTVTDPTGYVLPESGGVGTAEMYVLGGALFLSAALALVCDSRRRKARR